VREILQRSFDYLTHDADAKTEERVAWTHTLNCANDHVPSAVNEMLWTARDAELLKQEAGFRGGGRATENPVKHLSLNWSPEDNPTREHMIETTEEFLSHMKWQDHQAIIVAHDDKPYRHVHVMLNAIHPETGLKLDEGFEQRRAQAWALQYEREQGKIYCDQRLKNPEEREKSPPRNVWVEFREDQQQFERAEKSLSQQEEISPENQKNHKNDEWKFLKEIQRTERTTFFEQGKPEFSQLRLSIYREVREEFRGRWGEYYAAQRNGGDPESLAALKAELVADQKAVVEGRRDAACAELRESRDQRYRELLDDQRTVRADLRSRQEAGFDNTQFLEQVKNANIIDDRTVEFRAAGDEAVSTRGEFRAAGHEAVSTRGMAAPESDAQSSTQPRANADGMRLRVGFNFAGLFDSLFAHLANGGSPPEPPPRADPDLLRAAADETAKREQRERQHSDEDWRERQRSYGE
jgi:Relaxase/Mobilisation nuclease domain